MQRDLFAGKQGGASLRAWRFLTFTFTTASYEGREARMASGASLAHYYLEKVVCDGPVTVYVAYAGDEGRRPLFREQQVVA
jgi:hypothetical protein